LAPTWTILVATVGQRQDRLRNLLAGLLPQTEPHDGRVTVCALYNHGERPLGDVRQSLVEHATSDYVSFVDDDDELPSYHVQRVLDCADGEVDYVGWRMQTYVDNKKLLPTIHSLRFNRWFSNRRGHYRDISHLNPIRRELALKADFRRDAPPEDVSWSSQLRGLVKNECYVDDVMYVYRSSSTDTLWRAAGRRFLAQQARLDVDHPNFSWHPRSSE
jgi:hypothetical protein